MTVRSGTEPGGARTCFTELLRGGGKVHLNSSSWNLWIEEHTLDREQVAVLEAAVLSRVGRKTRTLMLKA